MVLGERARWLMRSRGYIVLDFLCTQWVGDILLIALKVNEAIIIFLHLENWGVLKVVLRFVDFCSLAFQWGW